MYLVYINEVCNECVVNPLCGEVCGEIKKRLLKVYKEGQLKKVLLKKEIICRGVTSDYYVVEFENVVFGHCSACRGYDIYRKDEIPFHLRSLLLGV